MSAIKKKFARVQSSISFFREQLWPYYKHPRWILGLERERNYYLSIVKSYDQETFKDEIVKQLQTELQLRKAAYDEAEVQFDEEINDLLKKVRDLKKELADVYAKNAELWTRIAGLLAGGDPNAVHTETASTDC